jgi:hypothetical protein
VKQVARAVGVRTEGCCQSMRGLCSPCYEGIYVELPFVAPARGGAVADESDGNDDVNQMDDMVADIGRGYDLEFEDPPPEVQNFCRLLTVSEEKVHDDIDMTVL